MNQVRFDIVYISELMMVFFNLEETVFSNAIFTLMFQQGKVYSLKENAWELNYAIRLDLNQVSQEKGRRQKCGNLNRLMSASAKSPK